MIAQDIYEHARLLSLVPAHRWKVSGDGITRGGVTILRSYEHNATPEEIALAVAARNALPKYIQAIADRDQRIRSLEQELQQWRFRQEAEQCPETLPAGHEGGGL